MKLKGLTKEQSEALLWCAEDWRAVRDHSGSFKSLGLAPYVEWTAVENSRGGFKYIKARLTPEGMARLIDVGIARFPHVAYNPRFSHVEWHYLEDAHGG